MGLVRYYDIAIGYVIVPIFRYIQPEEVNVCLCEAVDYTDSLLGVKFDTISDVQDIWAS